MKFILSFLWFLIVIKVSYATEHGLEKQQNLEQQKNISYASARIAILPLYELKQSVDTSNPNLIFIHPPKVGGTNVVFVMDAILGTDKSKRFSVPRVPGRSPGLITEGWIGGLLSLKEEIKNPQHKHEDYTFVNGHFPYGAHNYLPEKGYLYIALVRSPIEREVSSLNFDYQRGYVIKEQAEAYLLNVMLDNPQTRMLAGEEYMQGMCDEAVLERAKENLRTQFLLSGIIEETNIFIQALLSLLKLEPVAIGRSQVTNQKIFESVPDNLKEKLFSKHKYDIALYEHVKKHWNIWKQEHLGEVLPISPGQKILTILPEFAHTRKPEYRTSAEIEEYNRPYSENSLVQISQNHRLTPQEMNPTGDKSQRAR